MKYKIMVTIPFGIDDTLYCEYNGVEYHTKKEVEDIYKRIPLHKQNTTYGVILSKTIEEIE